MSNVLNHVFFQPAMWQSINSSICQCKVTMNCKGCLTWLERSLKDPKRVSHNLCEHQPLIFSCVVLWFNGHCKIRWQDVSLLYRWSLQVMDTYAYIAKLKCGLLWVGLTGLLNYGLQQPSCWLMESLALKSMSGDWDCSTSYADRHAQPCLEAKILSI